MSRAARWPGEIGRPYVQVPVALLRHATALGIDDGDLRLLIALESFRRGGGDSPVFPSQERLADLCGCSVRAVERRVAKLKRLGLIEVEREGRGGSRPNRYTRRGLDARLAELEASYPTRTSGSYPTQPSASRGDLPDADGGSYPTQASARYPTPVAGEVEAVEAEAGKQKSATRSARARIATEILAIFNEQQGSTFRAESWVRMIGDRVEEHPTLTLSDYREVIEAAFRRRWWNGAPSPKTIFRSAEAFEQALAERGSRDRPHGRFTRRSPVELEDGAAAGASG